MTSYMGTIIRITALSLLMGTSLRLTAQDRMPPIPTEKMTEEQKKAVAEFRADRKAELTGPWIALLRSPEVLTRARVLSDYLRFTSVLPPKLSEFVILMTARQWTQQYEWNAHYQIAMTAGLNPNIAKAIAEGRRPEHMGEDEESLYDFCLELQCNQSVSDATYARAVSRFGEKGVIDTVGLVGYYTMIGMVLNTARSPLPAGATPALAPFPR